MADHPTYGFGEPNWDLITRWLHLGRDQDGPVWMVNLMRYKEVADYGDGRRSVSGKEADDAYAPLGPLRAIGASVAFLGDVTRQLSGAPAWHRIGIVRYPTRASFFEMQQRQDFKAAFPHKKAGMDFTIVMACHPEPAPPPPPPGTLVMSVRRFDGLAPSDPAGVHPLVSFGVEGVVLGDQRRFDQVRFDLVSEDSLAAMTEGPVADQHVMVVRPVIDNLVAGVEEERSG